MKVIDKMIALRKESDALLSKYKFTHENGSVVGLMSDGGIYIFITKVNQQPISLHINEDMTRWLMTNLVSILNDEIY